jgi:hypothetical protein
LSSSIDKRQQRGELMMGIRAISIVACTVLTSLWAGQGLAAVVLWPSGSGGNDHYYEFVEVADPYTGINNAWTTAKAAANASEFNGQSGYLATITSQAENDFVLGLVTGQFSQSEGAWLGGKAPEGWLDGPEIGQSFGYTNWGGIEPNNVGQLWMVIGASSIYAPGKWADDSGPPNNLGPGDGIPHNIADPVIGYFVEYNAIPEPTSAILCFLGFVALAWGRRGLTSRWSPRRHPPALRAVERFPSVSFILRASRTQFAAGN